MRRSKSRGAVVVAAVVLVIAAIIYAFRIPVAEFVLAKSIGAATGTSVSIGHLSLRGGSAVVTDVHVQGPGARLAYIPRIDFAYNLRDVLPGSKHLYGLHALTIYNPQITVVHNADDTYNLPHMRKGGPARPNGTPLNFKMRVIGGTIAVIDHTRLDTGARHLTIQNVNVAANVDTAARTQYVASMAYNDAGRLYPINGRGTIDYALGLNDQQWTAAHLPLPQLINYALNNANLRMRAGFLDNLNARYYGAIAATAYLRGGRVTMQGVNAPIENVHGPLDVTSDALTTPHIDASIAGAPIVVDGAIYDLSHPKFRLVVHAHGDVARLKNLTTAAAHLPLRGSIALALLVEGAVRTPLALILTHSPEIDYRAMPLRDPNGLLAFDGHTATVLNFGVRYGGFTLGARGRMSLTKEPNAVEAVATVAGPSDELPYASSLFPHLTLNGTILATGASLKRIDTNGVLDGQGSTGTLASTFALASNGLGTVALNYASVPGRDTLNAKIALNHRHGSMDALVHANNFAITPAAAGTLPGLPVKGLPAASGTIAGEVFASRQGGALGLLGNVHLRDAQYGKMAITAADARFGGAPGNVRVAYLNANGNFGSVRARGTIAGTNHIALEGLYSGSLSQVSQFAGGTLPAQGVVNAPIALVYTNNTSVAQIHDARFSNAAIRGVPLEGLSATIGFSPVVRSRDGSAQNNITVYAARAQVAHGGSAIAQGSIGNGGHIAFSVTRFPVASGYASAAGVANGSLKSPNVNGALLLSNARYANYPIGGAAAFTYAGGTASVRDAIIDAGPALVAADGTVYPTYDLNAAASGLFSYSVFQGSVDANVHVGGSGTSPLIAGTLDSPEGNVHGLAYRNMHASIDGTPSDMSIRNGTVAVGSTALAFDAAVAPGTLDASLNAPHADLADFNDYFDTADTLGGSGHLAMSVAMTSYSLDSSGNVNLRNVRYKRFKIGDTIANWSTGSRSTSVNANVTGAHGTAHLAGTIQPETKTIAVNATARNVDLSNWLPLLGFNQPVTGYIDADAALRGRYPDISMNARANLRDGTLGRVHVQRAMVAADALNGRGHITQAVVQVPYLIAQGSGTFGLHRGDPLALAVRATSPDIGKLAQTFSGKPNELAGALDTTLHVGGTANDPNANDVLTISQLRYAKLSLPRVQAVANINKRRVALTQGRIDLTKGFVTASGDVPLHPAAKDRVALALTANSVNLSAFSSTMPKGTRVAGALNGTLRVGGTMDAPLLDGTMTLRNGYFVGPIDQNPISALDADLVFGGTTIALDNVHGKVGSGTLAMNATASVPTLRDFRAASFRSQIRATNAQINSPQYFRGKFNANINAYRNPGQQITTIVGNVDVPSARIPLTVFWNPHAPKKAPGPPLPLAFDITANAGNDVRVQSPNVDVGATGAVTVTGTMAAPKLSGQIASTGGTIDFLRRFTIQNANVSFDPSNGFWPVIDATADTQVSSPLTYIQLTVDGLAPNDMHLTFNSDPQYSQTQIMALLSGLGGNSNGTGGLTLGGEVQSLALGQVQSLFTRDIFEPLDVSLGNALGLQNLQITDDFTSGFGVSAVKAFGKHVTAVFAENLGEPKEQSLSIEAHHGNATAFNLMLYSVQDPPLTGFLSRPNPFNFDQLNNSTLTAVSGTNGLSLLWEHKFH
jgi:hypothetical protein